MKEVKKGDIVLFKERYSSEIMVGEVYSEFDPYSMSIFWYYAKTIKGSYGFSTELIENYGSETTIEEVSKNLKNIELKGISPILKKTEKLKLNL